MQSKKHQTLTLIAELNRSYVFPDDAGPARCAAYEGGVDLKLLVYKLSITPAERLTAHQKALNQVLALRDSMTHQET